jgi:hypothetical protein
MQRTEEDNANAGEEPEAGASTEWFRISSGNSVYGNCGYASITDDKWNVAKLLRHNA